MFIYQHYIFYDGERITVYYLHFLEANVGIIIRQEIFCYMLIMYPLIPSVINLQSLCPSLEKKLEIEGGYESK